MHVVDVATRPAARASTAAGQGPPACLHEGLPVRLLYSVRHDVVCGGPESKQVARLSSHTPLLERTRITAGRLPQAAPACLWQAWQVGGTSSLPAATAGLTESCRSAAAAPSAPRHASCWWQEPRGPAVEMHNTKVEMQTKSGGQAGGQCKHDQHANVRQACGAIHGI